MIGVHKVVVRNARNTYTFELKRNITILNGNSGSGKTTLFDMISDYNRDGRQSGVNLACDVPVIALDSYEWERKLEQIVDSIVVVDEDSRFINTYEFAKAVKNSSNYYLLITRNYLYQLPYSVDEVYEISGKKNKKFKHVYKSIDLIYNNPDKNRLPFRPDIIITEDSNSGYQFFDRLVSDTDIQCVSSQGKSKIYDTLKKYSDKKITIIADGAAFGCEMHAIVEKQKLDPHKLAVYLPESFEWILLSSGVVCDSGIDELVHPENHADSSLYVSWEQYFTQLLIDHSMNQDYMRYSKDRLTDYYLQKNVMQQIEIFINGIKIHIV